MQLVLGWPVRVLLIALVIFALFVDSAGYVYRAVNHLPLTGKVDAATMPPSFGWWPFNNGTIYIHQGLDLQGGSHLELQLTDIPPGRSHSEVQATAVSVFQKRLNSLGVSEAAMGDLLQLHVQCGDIGPGEAVMDAHPVAAGGD